MAKLLSNTFYWFSDSLVKGWLALFMRETAAIQSHSELTFFVQKLPKIETSNWAESRSTIFWTINDFYLRENKVKN